MSPSIPLRLLQTQSDARLVELARSGHELAFEALVHRYRKPLLHYCRRLLLPEARAEDALQQALMQAWVALRDGREVGNAKAWLYRVVHNAAISALRRSGYDYVELDESLHGARAAESDIDRRIAVRETLAGLAALPEAQREALLRTAVQGDSREEVAAALGLSDGAVRGLIYRARATLRAAATAFVPPPIVLWAARAPGSGAGHPQVVELVVGAGSAGLLGALVKGGAVVLSAGVLATGVTLIQHETGSSSNAEADSSRDQSHEAPGRSASRLNEGPKPGEFSHPRAILRAGKQRRGDGRRMSLHSTGNGIQAPEMRSERGRGGSGTGVGGETSSGGPSPGGSTHYGSVSSHDSAAAGSVPGNGSGDREPTGETDGGSGSESSPSASRSDGGDGGEPRPGASGEESRPSRGASGEGGPPDVSPREGSTPAETGSGGDGPSSESVHGGPTREPTSSGIPSSEATEAEHLSAAVGELRRALTP
jgi:RNA polymerase sigma factor (sigma-70 family)